MIISVTSDRQLAFPQEVQELLQPGDDYDLLMTVDGMLLKKVNRVDAVDRLNEDESARLYAEIYAEDLELQGLTAIAIEGWPVVIARD
jgi:hypothetical protein